MVYGLFRALPGVPGLIATVACGITRKLDTSVGVSGPHDFAVRIVSLASRYQCVHRILHPTSVAIARTPLLVGQDGPTQCP
jgi:hypothetical protein